MICFLNVKLILEEGVISPNFRSGILELINTNSSWLINSRQLQMFILYLHCLDAQLFRYKLSCLQGQEGTFRVSPDLEKEEGKGLCETGIGI